MDAEDGCVDKEVGVLECIHCHQMYNDMRLNAGHNLSDTVNNA